ncbi:MULTISPECIES: resolvase [unclassified Synechococcus]|uniref:resolvase n=1 Tax=unclassified Synechococcus TaxID=2626047 RepID=UPI0021A6F475|nr:MULTISPECIES: resolvase [unclassified Synechococcus]MCT0212738.1 resolvase [Synechococcus sp. CS-1326]MCT0233746.1 resolvase [Synechococcus sp. CS-1327]
MSELPAEGPLAGLDPGRSKCGLVRTDASRHRIEAALVLSPDETLQQLSSWIRRRQVSALVLGNGTGSQAWLQRLQPLCPVLLVDERGSTLAARPRYWQLHPARGWQRLLPLGLRQPPRPWDDVVAQVLLERTLGYRLDCCLDRPSPGPGVAPSP